MDSRFTDLCEYVPGLRCEPRYATSHNLTGHPLAGYRAQRVLGTRQLGDAMRLALSAAERQGLGLLVYDAYRPAKAVQDFVTWSRQPEDGATKAEFYPTLEKARLFELGYIAQRSGHSRGSTIDLTLTDGAGVMLDMGTCFDFMHDLSHHDAPGLTPEQAENRRILRGIMGYAGFIPYRGEWWHYLLMGEPFPDTYFDFDIE